MICISAAKVAAKLSTVKVGVKKAAVRAINHPNQHKKSQEARDRASNFSTLTTLTADRIAAPQVVMMQSIFLKVLFTVPCRLNRLFRLLWSDLRLL